MANTVDIKQLLEAGAHFGHKTSRWHPKMAPYIHSKRGGSHIIDLTKTAEKLEEAANFVEKQAAAGRQVLFVGTKRQAKAVVKEAAQDAKQPFVTERWLGGMLTNSNTINGRIKTLKELEAKMQSGELASRYNKLEVQRFQEQIDVMNYNYGGVKEMAGRPGVVFVADVLEDANAVKEAQKLGIPVVAIVDTNADPSDITYPIPANDDAIKSIKIIPDTIAEAVKSGRNKMKQPVAKKEETGDKPAPKKVEKQEEGAK
jgi:small subunit ribosomal protein S2